MDILAPFFPGRGTQWCRFLIEVGSLCPFVPGTFWFFFLMGAGLFPFWWVFFFFFKCHKGLCVHFFLFGSRVRRTPPSSQVSLHYFMFDAPASVFRDKFEPCPLPLLSRGRSPLNELKVPVPSFQLLSRTPFQVVDGDREQPLPFSEGFEVVSLLG